MIRSIFLFMDRQLPSVNPKYLPLWYVGFFHCGFLSHDTECNAYFPSFRDLALNLFRENIVMHASIQPRILKQVLDLISQERRGANVDRDLLRSVIRMYSDLQVCLLKFERILCLYACIAISLCLSSFSSTK